MVLAPSQVVGNGVSEPSTVGYNQETIHVSNRLGGTPYCSDSSDTGKPCNILRPSDTRVFHHNTLP